MNKNNPSYRPDIDGLRAIAVLSVVGFHVSPTWLQGGFWGVDVFFVISGFLITSIILESLNSSTFSFAHFFGRRIRRIFPALIAVLFASFLIGYFFYFPDENKALGKHLFGGGSFSSNFMLWGESGYFDDDATRKTLLHLWSLSIEEQFYLVWPAVLLLLWRFRLNVMLATGLIVVLSFAFGITQEASQPIASFFSPLTRAWQLLAGAFLAQHFHRQKIALAGLPSDPPGAGPGRAALEAASVVGIACLLLGIAWAPAHALNRTLMAVLPTAGAVLVIYAGPRAWLNRHLLSSRLFVWFGLISYPLYLWHWPLLASGRVLNGEVLPREVRVLLALLSVLLAWATYRFVEKPIQRKGGTTAPLVGAMVLIACLGAGTYLFNGLPPGKSDPVLANTGDLGEKAWDAYFAEHSFPCDWSGGPPIEFSGGDFNRCVQSKKSGRPTVVVVGDSHAEHFFVGVAGELSNLNVASFRAAELPYADNPQLQNTFRRILGDPGIKHVFLSANWHSKSLAVADFGAQMSNTATTLTAAGKRVYLLSDVPTFSFDAQNCKYSRRPLSKNQCAESQKVFADKYQAYYPALVAAQKVSSMVTLLNTFKEFCGDSVCNMAKDGKLFFRDQNHLNIDGSNYAIRQMMNTVPALQVLAGKR